MMSDRFCGYEGQRDEMIVAYVYGELTASERAAFARHLTRCLACQAEIEALSDLRVDLAEWSPSHSGSGVVGDLVTRTIGNLPGNSNGGDLEDAGRNTVLNLRPRREPSFRAVQSVDGASPVEGPIPSGTSGRRAFGRELPAWAQFAAAMLFVGVAAGLANLQVTYNGEGLMVRTGWSGNAAVPATAAAPAATAADLMALSNQLRDELRDELRSELHADVQNEVQTTAAAPMATAGKLSKDEQDELVRRVRALLKDSEQRQQRELALRVAEVAQDVQAQRQADLVRIDRTLGALQNTTGTAVRRQEQLLNSLAVRVSQRQ